MTLEALIKDNSPFPREVILRVIIGYRYLLILLANKEKEMIWFCKDCRGMDSEYEESSNTNLLPLHATRAHIGPEGAVAKLGQ